MEPDKTENIIFESFQLDPAILDALREMGYTTPTPVQEQAIPLVLEGKDVIALAETGSGKGEAIARLFLSEEDETAGFRYCHYRKRCRRE